MSKKGFVRSTSMSALGLKVEITLLINSMRNFTVDIAIYPFFPPNFLIQINTILSTFVITNTDPFCLLITSQGSNTE